MVHLQENWEDFANAIIIQAAKDYRMAYRRLLKHPNSKAVQEDVRRLEAFFFGKWYASLTRVDAHYLVDRLKGEIDTSLPPGRSPSHPAPEGLPEGASAVFRSFLCRQGFPLPRQGRKEDHGKKARFRYRLPDGWASLPASCRCHSVCRLRGKRVGVGAANSGVEINARMILAAYGITYDDITNIPEYLLFFII